MTAYAIIFWSMYATLLGRSILHCSVEICYTVPSKFAICRNMLLFVRSMLHCSFELCYTARSKYATLLGPSMLQFSVQVGCTLRPKSMLHCSVQVRCSAHTPHRSSKWSVLLIYCMHVSFSSSMLHCSVQVCYIARSKYAILLDKVCCTVQSEYATLLGRSLLYCCVEVCYTVRPKYATLLAHLIFLGFITQTISSEG